MDFQPIDRGFFERDALTVARELVGKLLVSGVGGVCAGRVVETEAYLGALDDAAHTYKGMTERTRVAFGEKGRAYVYLIYGVHHCLNVTAGGDGCLVLLRALEPVYGLELMRSRRSRAVNDFGLCSGPGRLCAALGVDRSLYGADMCSQGALFFAEAESSPDVVTSARIGIDYSEKSRLEPWRFCERGSRFVSRRPREMRTNGGGVSRLFALGKTKVK